MSQAQVVPLRVAERARPASPRCDVLAPRERAIALALAEACLPGGRVPGGDSATIDRLERMMTSMGDAFVVASRASLRAADAFVRARRGASLTDLAPADVVAEIDGWLSSRSKHARWFARALLVPMKQAHFDDAAVHAAVGVAYGREAPRVVEAPRYAARIIDGHSAPRDLDLVCDVVVVGSGAGGAAAAFELAKRGRAVLVLEGGRAHARTGFDGHAPTAMRKMYLAKGTTFALGNAAALVLAGRGVGGTTTINSGTCFRAPERTLERWAARYGLTMLAGDALAPYYERVEAMLGVAPVEDAYVGGSARVVARGASALGMRHAPLPRNAPGCDGQGVCCFGCPTGAKRSTEVSYLAEALARGAELVTGADVERVIVEDGRARGVVAHLGSGRSLRVRADAVVVAGGALLTPLLLRRSGACASSGWLGKNLSIHPATKVFALVDEDVDMSSGVPQSYGVHDLADEGIMFEGASVPLDVAAIGLSWVGPRFMDVMASYRNLAAFGLMVQDHARGEVLPGPSGLPVIRYDMSRHDVERMHRGVVKLTEIFLRGGARRVLPLVHGCDEVRDDADLAKLRALRVRAGDMEVSAYHPLGTCRMGTDPSRSCIGPTGEAHDTEGLFVADGSAVPSSLGVNPQMTIMALALRTAERVDARLDDLGRAPERPAFRPRSSGVSLRFGETMSGGVRLAADPHRNRPIEFTLRAASPLGELARRRAVTIEGTIRIDGFATERPARGKLGMDFVVTRRIPYELFFEADDGRAYRLVGEKTVRPAHLLASMTKLPVQLRDDDEALVGEGEMRFDVLDLPTFAATFRLGRA